MSKKKTIKVIGPPTRQELLNDIQALTRQRDDAVKQNGAHVAEIDHFRKRVSDEATAASNANAREKNTREQFADLKIKLHHSELEVARLRGYLARVHEQIDERSPEISKPNYDPHTGNPMPPFTSRSAVVRQMNVDLAAPANAYGEARDREMRHWITY